jgi:phospholipid transport system substrate-binding protein
MIAMTPARTRIATCALVLVALAAVARAGDGPGTRAVRKANETVKRLLKKKLEPGSAAEKRQAAQVTKRLRSFLDIDELGQRALVDHWTTLDETKRGEYLGLLRELIEKNYVKGLRANLEYAVRYTGEKKKGEHLLVSTEIEAERRGRPFTIAVDYLLRKDGAGWRTFDVITDGVGLVENYRAQFNKIIGKHGFDGLLERMRKKRDSM